MARWRKRQQKRRRRRRVPGALLRVYGGRVQTLEAAILSLLPHPPSTPAGCSCDGRGCLGCGSLAYLLRKCDPTDYRILLNRGFCVISSDAPPSPRVFTGVGIPKPLTNESCFNIVGELLCTPTWDLLLHRIGSELMIFLIRFSSIFIPIQNKSYHQITGHPMDKVYYESKSFHTSLISCNEQPFSKTMQDTAYPRNNVKRKRGDTNGRSNVRAAAVPAPNSFFNIASSKSKYLAGNVNTGSRRSSEDFKQMMSWTKDIQHDSKELKMINLCEDTYQDTAEHDTLFPDSVLKPHYQEMPLKKLKSTCTKYQYYEVGFLCTDIPNKSTGLCSNKKPRKHRRLFSWQRRRKVKAPEKNISEGNNKETSKAELFDSDCNYCWPSQQPGTITSAASTGRGTMMDSVLTPSKFTEAIRDENSHPVLAQEISQGQKILLIKKPYPYISAENNGPERQSDVDSLSIQSQHFEELSHCENRPMCFYCLMMQQSQKVGSGDQIGRRFIFYNKTLSYSVFPKNHILNRLKPNDSDAINLMKHIFRFPDGNRSFLTCVDCSHGSVIKSQCLYHSLLRLLKSLIRNARRCQRNMLLFKHCIQTSKYHCQMEKAGHPSPQGVSIVHNITPACIGALWTLNKQTYSGSKIDAQSSSVKIIKENRKSHQEDSHSTSELIESYSKHHQVVSFIWAVCRSIIPTSLLGDTPCWRSLQKNISKFVKLHRYEDFHLKQCIHGIKMSCYSYLSKVGSSQCFCNDKNKFGSGEHFRKSLRKNSNDKILLPRNFFNSWMHWFFSDFVVPIISANFYVTERQSGKYKLFYYPKPVWKELVQKTITSLEKNFELLNEESATSIIIKRINRSFGFSKVRFLPKDTCLRPLANLSSSSVVHFPAAKRNLKYNSCERIPVIYQSVNSALKELNVILRRVKIEKPELLGSSVFDYNDVYLKLHQFLSQVKIRQSKMLEIYIVVADVLKAFDSIVHDRLIDILKNILENNKYYMSKHVKISCWKKNLKITYDHVLPCDYNSSNLASGFKPSFQFLSSSSILTDKEVPLVWNKEQALSHLEEHLKWNILQIGKDFYLQKVGISQGSVLSSLLCSYYYADMEKKEIWPYLQRNSKHDMESSTLQENLLLRLVDDFIFISTSKEQATRFFDRMRRGFGSYNCSMNKKKFGTNFDIARNNYLVNRVYTGADGVSFLPWSGLLVNCQTLEIQADYTRYFNINMRATITIKVHHKPLYHLKEKLFSFVRTRCHPIFYDSNINSLAIVSLNAYQAFLLSAMKFHCYVRGLKDVIKLNPIYLLEIIERSLRYMYKHIKKLMRDMLHRSGLRPTLILQKREMFWLGLYAYARVLRKKHSQHKKLLSLLVSKISQHESIEDSPHLRYALDESHSSCFLKIQF